MATVDFDKLANGTDRTKRDDGSDRAGNWQVIFKIEHNGQVMDYCRETKPGSMSREAILKWAKAQCAAHKLHGAVIERW